MDIFTILSLYKTQSTIFKSLDQRKRNKLADQKETRIKLRQEKKEVNSVEYIKVKNLLSKGHEVASSVCLVSTDNLWLDDLANSAISPSLS